MRQRQHIHLSSKSGVLSDNVWQLGTQEVVLVCGEGARGAQTVVVRRGGASSVVEAAMAGEAALWRVSYGPPWAHYLSEYQDRLLGGPLGLPDLRCMAPAGVKHKDYGGEVLG
jgi:hypothetical protein